MISLVLTKKLDACFCIKLLKHVISAITVETNYVLTNTKVLRRILLKKIEENDTSKESENIHEKKKQNGRNKKETAQSVIIEAFEKDSEEHYEMNKDCGLNNSSQKCNRCKFVTHSMGLLRIHEKNVHKVYHNFEKIVDGFKFDNLKYFEVLSAMYDGDELNKNSCEECNFKTHSAGILKLHISNSHQQTSDKWRSM